MKKRISIIWFIALALISYSLFDIGYVFWKGYKCRFIFLSADNVRYSELFCNWDSNNYYKSMAMERDGYSFYSIKTVDKDQFHFVEIPKPQLSEILQVKRNINGTSFPVFLDAGYETSLSKVTYKHCFIVPEAISILSDGDLKKTYETDSILVWEGNFTTLSVIEKEELLILFENKKNKTSNYSVLIHYIMDDKTYICISNILYDDITKILRLPTNLN